MSKTLVIYHKNCMDGLGSAAAYKLLFKNGTEHEVIFKAVQHGTPEKEEFLKNLSEDERDCNELVFLDFSLDKKQIIEASKVFEKIMIIDHHKTSQEDLSDQEVLDIENLELIFDMSKSGALLTWEYVNKITPIDEDIPFIFVQYIQDRDLWQWKLKDSKEFSEGLRMEIDRRKKKIELNILNQEEREIQAFLDVCFYPLEDIIGTGKILIEKTDMMVDAKTNEKKLFPVWFGDIEVLMLNATENISEIGNAICLKYNKPACMYFITETGRVVFSLRSTDDLPDASKIAKAYGGGGHRNACGFSGDLLLLNDLLNDNTLLKK